jgi:glycosyltransferase involved in cell wall biosynthesis
MKILHTETLKRWGGQQSRVLQQAIGLSRRGHGIVLACNRGSMLSQRARDAGIRTYELNLTKWSYHITIPQLIDIIRKEEVDIVCTNSSIDSWAGGIAARLTGRELVRIKHNVYRIKKDLPTRFIYSLPEVFIAVSDSAGEVIKNTGYIKPEKVSRIYGAVDTVQFDPEKITDGEKISLKNSLGIPENSLVIGNTSGFTGVKGQRYLLEAANTLLRERDDIFIVLAGWVSHRERILEHVKAEFHKRIILPGLRNDVPLLLSIFDLFVFPSTMEACPYSLIEAMAMARPVLVSDISSLRDFLSDGIDGIFFRSADVSDLLKRLRQLIERPGKWEKLGLNARETVLRRFQIERLFDETEKIYLGLMRGDSSDVS